MRTVNYSAFAADLQLVARGAQPYFDYLHARVDASGAVIVICPDCDADLDDGRAWPVSDFSAEQLEDIDRYYANMGGLFGGHPSVPTHLIVATCPAGHNFMVGARESAKGQIAFRCKFGPDGLEIVYAW